MLGYIEVAKNSGARLVAGGGRPSGPGPRLVRRAHRLRRRRQQRPTRPRGGVRTGHRGHPVRRRGRGRSASPTTPTTGSPARSGAPMRTARSPSHAACAPAPSGSTTTPSTSARRSAAKGLRNRPRTRARRESTPTSSTSRSTPGPISFAGRPAPQREGTTRMTDPVAVVRRILRRRHVRRCASGGRASSRRTPSYSNAAGTLEGADAITTDVRERPRARCVEAESRTLVVDGERVAVEIELDADGSAVTLADFFTVRDGKIQRLAIYSLAPTRCRDLRQGRRRNPTKLNRRPCLSTMHSNQ